MQKKNGGPILLFKTGFENMHVKIAGPADDAGPDAIGQKGPGQRAGMTGGMPGHSNAR